MGLKSYLDGNWLLLVLWHLVGLSDLWQSCLKWPIKCRVGCYTFSHSLFAHSVDLHITIIIIVSTISYSSAFVIFYFIDESNEVWNIERPFSTLWVCITFHCHRQPRLWYYSSLLNVELFFWITVTILVVFFCSHLKIVTVHNAAWCNGILELF